MEKRDEWDKRLRKKRKMKTEDYERRKEKGKRG